MIFVEGGKYTIVAINNMAMSCRREITICGEIDGKVTYKLRGKRTQYFLDVGKGFVFEGWDLPLKVDTDSKYGIMRGNACFNFVGNPDTIRTLIDTKNLNPQARKGIALVVDGDKEELLYPDQADEGHAVIERIVSKTL